MRIYGLGMCMNENIWGAVAAVSVAGNYADYYSTDRINRLLSSLRIDLQRPRTKRTS